MLPIARICCVAAQKIAEGAVGAVLNREQLMALYDAPVEKITDQTAGVSAFLPG